MGGFRLEGRRPPPRAERIAKAASDILGHPVAPRDNLFDVGGNSLTAISLVAHLRAQVLSHAW